MKWKFSGARIQGLHPDFPRRLSAITPTVNSISTSVGDRMACISSSRLANIPHTLPPTCFQYTQIPEFSSEEQRPVNDLS
jgi:hypothetical protein